MVREKERGRSRERERDSAGENRGDKDTKVDESDIAATVSKFRKETKEADKRGTIAKLWSKFTEPSSLQMEYMASTFVIGGINNISQMIGGFEAKLVGAKADSGNSNNMQPMMPGGGGGEKSSDEESSEKTKGTTEETKPGAGASESAEQVQPRKSEDGTTSKALMTGAIATFDKRERSKSREGSKPREEGVHEVEFA